MQTILNSFSFIFLLFLCLQTFAQDSTATDDDEDLTSEFVISADYSSQALAAGRNLGITQFAITPSLNYYHKSGIWAGVSGYVLENTDPNYNSTALSIGYDGNFTEDWSFAVSYGHNFFTPTDAYETNNPLANSLNAGTSYDFKYINTGLSYTYLFGEDTGNQLGWDIGAFFPIKLKGRLRKISFAPSFGLLWGNEKIVANRLPERLRRRFPNFNPESNEFGLMNMDIRVPVSFYVGDFRLKLSYNIALPQKLNDSRFDRTDYSAVHYWGVGMSYTIR